MKSMFALDERQVVYHPVMGYNKLASNPTSSQCIYSLHGEIRDTRWSQRTHTEHDVLPLSSLCTLTSESGDYSLFGIVAIPT